MIWRCSRIARQSGTAVSRVVVASSLLLNSRTANVLLWIHKFLASVMLAGVAGRVQVDAEGQNPARVDQGYNPFNDRGSVGVAAEVNHSKRDCQGKLDDDESELKPEAEA